MNNRNIISSPRLLELKRQRRRSFQNKAVLGIIVFFIIIGAFSYISRIDSLNISTVEITGNKVIETEAIKKVVEGEIAGNYLWLFPKTNIFIYPKNNIENALKTYFKGLRDAEPSIVNEKILAVAVSEREALYTWCGNALPEPQEPTDPAATNSNTPRQKCFFLDKEGYIFYEAPFFSGNVYFKFYGSIDAEENTPIGAYFFKNIFNNLTAFITSLENMGLKSVALYVGDNGDVTAYLPGASEQTGPEILFKKDADSQILAENLQAALLTEPLRSKLKNHVSPLQYIDLRFGNKVYFK